MTADQGLQVNRWSAAVVDQDLPDVHSSMTYIYVSSRNGTRTISSRGGTINSPYLSLIVSTIFILIFNLKGSYPWRQNVKK